MRVGVCGGRGRKDKERVKEYIRGFCRKSDVIVSGGADGVDKWAEEVAEEEGLKKVIYLPQSRTQGAFLERNTQIAEGCDWLLAFPSSTSRGTWDTVNKAKALGKDVTIIDSTFFQWRAE